MVVRITTWNVNGIRNPFGYQPWRDGKTFDAMFDILEADIVIMQELKIQWKDLRDDMVLVPGWDCYFSLPKHKKGYSGVGIYTRNSVCAPIKAEEGLLGVLCGPGSTVSYRDLPEHQAIGGYPTAEQVATIEVDPAALDAEGRCVVLEFPAFVLFGIYSPANSSGLRDDFRFGFINALDFRIRNLVASGKRVVVTGDLNVSPNELDQAGAADILRKEGITLEEYLSTPNRRIFNQLIEDGQVMGERDKQREQPVLWDICRGFHPTRKGMYTHWEQKKNARPGNYGSRIDYILCSSDMKPWFCASDIQEGLMGSDHCPVYAVMKDVIDINGAEVHLRDILSPSGTFNKGTRIKEYTLKDPCPLSGRMLTGFDKRRSIRDMFTNKPGPKILTPAHSPPLEELSFVDRESFDSGNDLTPASETLAAVPEVPQSQLSTVADTTVLHSESIPAATTSPSRGAEKRSKPQGEGKTPPAKRTKSSFSNGSNNASMKGQKSLMNFFATKPSTSTDREGDDNETGEVDDINNIQMLNDSLKAGLLASETPGTLDPEDPETREEQSREHEDSQTKDRPSHPTENCPSPPLLVDPIVSKESWSKIFSKPSAPRCEGHSEPCQLMKTKKKGFNCGREFYMCSRPLGPTGEKERNSQWRCGTFIWASDWNMKSENGL